MSDTPIHSPLPSIGRAIPTDAVEEMIFLHGEIAATHPSCCFELFYNSEEKAWGAWLATHNRGIMDRKVLAFGQGETPNEAARECVEFFYKSQTT